MEILNTDLRSSPPTSSSCRGLGHAKSAEVKLFGVRLTSENSMVMRKAVSMGNLSCYSSTSLQPPQPSTPEHSESGNPHGYVSADGLLQNSASLRERKKGVPWTEDEHRMFLIGLQKLGKGDWRGISRTFVPSRTPTQVASHAQKYFLRQSNLNKRKRRSSLFDIISSNSVPSQNTLIPAAMELNSTSPKLTFNLAAPITTFEPPSTSLKSALVNVNTLGSDCASISAELCLGATHKSPQQSWLHTFSSFSSSQQADVANAVPASPSTSDCMQLLPPSSVMSHRSVSEREMVRPTALMASTSTTTSSSLTKLCRIDEATDFSAANLRLSIGPSIRLEPMELSLKLEQPVSNRHTTGMAGTNTGSNTLTNAIRVV